MEKFKKLKAEDPYHIYLTQDELQQIVDFDFLTNETLIKANINVRRLDKIRDLLVFACSTGLRESDFSNIKPENVEFEIIWGRSKCSLRRDYDMDNYYFEKRLDKLKKKGFRLEQIIIVDDTPEKSRNNYGNAVYIKEYSGDKSDEEL